MTRTSTEKILNYLTESKEHNDDKIKSFLNYTNSLDKYRKQSFKKSCSELYQAMYDHNPNYFENE